MEDKVRCEPANIVKRRKNVCNVYRYCDKSVWKSQGKNLKKNKQTLIMDSKINK